VLHILETYFSLTEDLWMVVICSHILVPTGDITVLTQYTTAAYNCCRRILLYCSKPCEATNSSHACIPFTGSRNAESTCYTYVDALL